MFSHVAQMRRAGFIKPAEDATTATVSMFFVRESKPAAFPDGTMDAGRLRIISWTKADNDVLPILPVAPYVPDVRLESPAQAMTAVYVTSSGTGATAAEPDDLATTAAAFTADDGGGCVRAFDVEKGFNQFPWGNSCSRRIVFMGHTAAAGVMHGTMCILAAQPESRRGIVAALSIQLDNIRFASTDRIGRGRGGFLAKLWQRQREA